MSIAFNIHIRKGLKTDLPQVHALIKELAIYERAPDEVSNTIADMERDGFGDNPVFSFFVAETSDHTITGMALYYTKYSTWKGRCIFLEDIIVSESYRGRGIGKALLEMVIEQARRENASRLEFQVLNWNKPAIDFYKKFNVQLDDEWINVKFTAEQLKTYRTDKNYNV